LKAHDVLLEVDGKPVSSDPAEFVKALESVKANTPVDVVVLRKGKKETLKGLSLPEKAAALDLAVPALPPLNVAPPAVAGVPGFAIVGGAPGAGVMTTTFRTNDHFTTRHQEGSLVITLT